MIIGAQGFTIRDYAQNEADFRETAKKLHDIGYKTLQVSASVSYTHLTLPTILRV